MHKTIAAMFLGLLVTLAGCQNESNTSTNISFEVDSSTSEKLATDDGASSTDTTTSNEGETTEPVTSPKTQLPPGTSIAFVTNQIADFWQIAKAGCEDAEKDFDIRVDVRMPSQATAVEQKRIVEDLLTAGVDAIAISPLDADNQINWLNEIGRQVPLITHDSEIGRAHV